MVAISAAVITAFILWPRTRADLWRVDETHKVSETYALRLVLEGRWRDPAWTANIIDRSNPPFGKYAFGVAVLAAGEELPRTPSLSRLAPNGVMEPLVGGIHARPYLPLLAPCRRVSLLATAITVGLIAFVAARTHSALAAVIASGWGGAHWMTSLFGGDAIFDPLLTFLVFATLPLVVNCHPEPAKRDDGPPVSSATAASRRGSFTVFAAPNGRAAMLIAPFAGLLCAMAFQTRLNGGIALAAAIIVLLVSKRWKAAVIVAATFAIASIAMNPYYWPDVIGRFDQQVSDLRTILGALTRDGVRVPLWAADSPARAPIEWTTFAKLRFTWITLGGALLVSAVAGCFFARRQRGMLIWCAVVIIGTFIWLPLPWPRYLLVQLPPLTLLAGIGYAAGVRAVFDAWR